MFSSTYTLMGRQPAYKKHFPTSAVAGLHWTCPNHLKRAFLNLSPIDANPKCSRMHLFLTLIFPTLPTHPSQHSHLFYTHFVMSCFLIGQYFATYAITRPIHIPFSFFFGKVKVTFIKNNGNTTPPTTGHKRVMPTNKNQKELQKHPQGADPTTPFFAK